jgi:hypothetical protein
MSSRIDRSINDGAEEELQLSGAAAAAAASLSEAAVSGDAAR